MTIEVNEKTTVPLLWLIISIISSVSFCAIGLKWTFQVDNRLERIEEKLGIVKQPSSYNANAQELSHHGR